MRFFSCVILFAGVLTTSCAYQVVSPATPDISDAKRLTLAQTHLLLGQGELAKRQLNQVAHVHQDRKYWRLLSLSWLTLDLYEEAFETHKQALSYYPNDDFLLNNLGVLLGLKERWKEACEVFSQADRNSVKKRQSVQINLARCALRQNDVNLARNYLKHAKEIADLPLIGLMTELNLVLIQGSPNKARIIFDNIQTGNQIARGTVHFDEYRCLLWQFKADEAATTQQPLTSDFSCLNGSRY